MRVNVMKNKHYAISSDECHAHMNHLFSDFYIEKPVPMAQAFQDKLYNTVMRSFKSIFKNQITINTSRNWYNKRFNFITQ